MDVFDVLVCFVVTSPIVSTILSDIKRFTDTVIVGLDSVKFGSDYSHGIRIQLVSCDHIPMISRRTYTMIC